MVTNAVDFITWIQCKRYVSCRQSLHTSFRVSPIVIDTLRFTEQMHGYFKRNFDTAARGHGWYVSESGEVLCPSCHQREVYDLLCRGKEQVRNGDDDAKQPDNS